MLDPYRIPSQTFAGKLIRLPLRLVPDSIDVPVVRGPNKGLRWRTGSSVHGCWLGTYEHEQTDLIRRHVKPGMVAYDIGANAGYYTLLLSRLVGPSGRVYAFEPLPENLVNLTHHVSINGLANCKIVAAAVSDRTGMAGFRIAGSNSMGSLAEGDAQQLRVPTISLDDLAANLGVPPPDFVKMDVEGAEGLVLSGASRLLAGRDCFWFVALHGEEQARTCSTIFRQSGYRVRDLKGRDVGDPSLVSQDEIYAARGTPDR